MEHPFRKWRFKIKIYSAKTMVTLCKKLTNNEKRDKVLIGFGDWSKKDGSPIKGRYGPVKKFRAELCRWAHVLDVDEYHTSKRCSECKNTQTVKCANRCRFKKETKRGMDH